MKYISTRGQAPTLNFEDVVLTGLANDGGLYLPESLPFYAPETIASWASLSYEDLAFEVMYPFVGDTIPADDFKRIIHDSYTDFRHHAIAPVKQLGHNEWLLELFHGPTLAFKDFALQFLGKLLDYLLKKRGEKVAVLGATSGDTGSAAIYGCRGCDNIDIFILHPHEKVSPVQRKQMTSVLDDNVHNIALEGNFDDCQNIVKASFRDQTFLPDTHRLVAVNSINWARIMAQIVYYFYAALSIGAPARSVNFSVPTGNFGDIFAGYLARKMGLPVQQLVIATNQNDILHDFISANRYGKKPLKPSLSPSMDIAISSNFERLLFDLHNQDGNVIRALMEQFNNEAITVDESIWQKARALFSSYSVDDEGTCAIIRLLYETTEEILDPHSAIGVKAARECWQDSAVPMITLATAHPAKFSDAITKAGLDTPSLPHHLRDLMDRKERFSVLPDSLEKVQAFVAQRVG